MTALATSRAERARQARRRDGLDAIDRLMRERVGLAPAPVPVPLHKMAIKTTAAEVAAAAPPTEE